MSTKYTSLIVPMILCALAAPTAVAEPLTDEERTRMESELEKTREEIQRLSERLADLSLDLVDEEIEHAMVAVEEFQTEPRALLGVVLSTTEKDRDNGPVISAVSPDGPADKAGIRSGDRVVALDGTALSKRHGSRDLIEYMDRVQPGETVRVTVNRDGEERDFDVETTTDDFSFSFSFNDENFVFDGEALGETIGNAVSSAMHGLDVAFFGFNFPDLEVVELTPGLGDYFGVTEGLLVVRAPKNGNVDVRDGDVLVEVDGRSLNDPGDLFRILGKREKDETVSLKLIRQRQTLTVDVRLPDISSHHSDTSQIFIQRAIGEN
ncbi:MAG: PDZ domain-containing protein [Pseudomonadota bacterium]